MKSLKQIFDPTQKRRPLVKRKQDPDLQVRALMKFLKKKIPVNWSMITALMIFLLFLFFADTLFHSKNMFYTEPVQVQIPENSSAKDISQILFLEGVTDKPGAFIISARLLNLTSRLKSGNYYFNPSMSNYSILKKLSEGRSSLGQVRLIVPEGSSIYRISKNLAAKNIVLDRPFNEAALKGNNADLVLKYAFLKSSPIESLEGYLFPDTYYIASGMKAQDIIEMMLSRFEEIVIPVWNSSRMNKYSLHQILTLASIVEKEAEIDSERPVIASVFYNRLESGIALRADPTVKYSIPNPGKKVTYNDLKYPSPYNTYLNKGLPPGPICNPGLKSILAAIHPANTKYIYFVSNGDGTHTFSSTWAGHSKAVQRFRKIRRPSR